MAIGAIYNNDGGAFAGHVRIYEWNGSAWAQKGSDIDGEAENDQSGYSVSMPDASTVAIGAPYNDGNGTDSGHVRIYTWNGSAWAQKGSDIDGETANNYSGFAVSMPDANTVAIGAYLNNNDGGFQAGHVRIYMWNGSSWIPKGDDIDGDAAYDHFGYFVSMPDADIVAIGAPDSNAVNGNFSGYVRIYAWDSGTSSWEPKGNVFNGTYFSRTGLSVSMPDANTVGFGAPFYANGNYGQVRVFYWDGDSWELKGSDIYGGYGTYTGLSVSMPDVNTLAIGASNFARIYTWSGSAWVLNSSIIGEEVGDKFGSSVSMSDANTVAIGASENDGSDTESGHVRIYTGFSLGIEENDIGLAIVSYPNPTDGKLTIDLKNGFIHAVVVVRNILGQEVARHVYNSTDRIQLGIPQKAGMYMIEVNADGRKALLKVIKK
ncbi:MAG TPA: T9SS type A sorting domain-containing protein [Flavobacteriaceae bacterium]|nr:T9SS type A sorting domain-containing protein [Flavobacteriaceae bacterium]